MAMSQALKVQYRKELANAPTLQDMDRVARSVYLMYHRGVQCSTVLIDTDDIIRSAKAILYQH